MEWYTYGIQNAGSVGSSPTLATNNYDFIFRIGGLSMERFINPYFEPKEKDLGNLVQILLPPFVKVKFIPK